MIPFLTFSGEPNTNAVDQQGTVSGAAVTLLSLLAGGALHADTKFVRITCETDDVRYTVGATNPTATLGTKLTDGSSRVLSRGEADNCRLIRVSTDAVIQIIQYRN